MFDLPEGLRPSDRSDELAASAVPEEIRSSFHRLAAVDFTCASEQELCDSATDFELLRRSLDAAECHVLAELDSRGVTDRAFGLRTAQWLTARTGLPQGVARARVATARKIVTTIPDVDKALTNAEIGFDHAKAYADATNPRITEEMATLAAQLCGEAKDMLFGAWSRRVRAVAELLDQDGGYDPDSDLAKNKLRLSTTGDTSILKGELVGEHALIASEVLNQIADELFRKFSHDNEMCPELQIPERSTLLALALVEACRRGISTPTDSSRAPRPEASIILTPTSAAPDCHVGPGSAGTQSSRQFDSWQHLPEPEKFAGMTVTDGSGHPLKERAWRTLLCDPDMYAVVMSSLGVPLELGRQTRFATRQQRRALAVRDGGCVFPGCTSPPSWTDAHHVVSWEHGGPTDLTNLVSLCRHHHGVAHRRGWKLDLDADGWAVWNSPNGNTFDGQRNQMKRMRPPP